jgi:hypothetical protein
MNKDNPNTASSISYGLLGHQWYGFSTKGADAPPLVRIKVERASQPHFFLALPAKYRVSDTLAKLRRTHPSIHFLMKIETGKQGLRPKAETAYFVGDLVVSATGKYAVRFLSTTDMDARMRDASKQAQHTVTWPLSRVVTKEQRPRLPKQGEARRVFFVEDELPGRAGTAIVMD